MPNLGAAELIIIFVIALLVFGPKKLPELGKSLGKGIREFKRATDDLKANWDEQIREAERSLEVKDEPKKGEPQIETTSHETQAHPTDHTTEHVPTPAANTEPDMPGPIQHKPAE